MSDVLIIGCGVVGSNLLKELSALSPDVVDKYKTEKTTKKKERYKFGFVCVDTPYDKEKELFDKPCGSATNTSSTSTNTNTFNQHLHDLQWAINQDKLVTHKLKEDGLYGTNTDNALKKCCVKNGSKGNIVSWVQCRVGAIVDGKAGNNTTTRIKEYQKSKDLTEDGIAGYNTFKSLLRDFGVSC